MKTSQQLRHENIETIRAFFGPKARQPGGAKFRASLCAPDALKQMAYPIGREYTQLQPMQNLQKLLLEQPDVNTGLDLEGILWSTEDANVVWAEIKEHGQITVAGKTGPFNGWGNHIFTLHNGKIKQWRTFYNTYTVYPALGLSPGRPSPDGFAARPAPSPEEAADAAAALELFQRELDPFLPVYALPWEEEGGVRTRLLVKETWCAADAPRRAANREQVEMYFSADLRADKGVALRKDLYAPDGMTQIPYNHMSPLGPDVTLFVEKNMGAGGAGSSWHVAVQGVYPTADPDEFWVETRAFHDDTGVIGGGGPSFMDRRYWNNYTFFFSFSSQGIRLAQEFLDPHSERRVMGLIDPELPVEAERFYLYL